MTFDLPSAEQMDRIEKQNIQILQQLSALNEKFSMSDVVTIADIASIEGCSETQLRAGGRSRYLLPRFGESAYPTGYARWPRSEYEEWRKIDPRDRQQMWRKHLDC